MPDGLIEGAVEIFGERLPPEAAVKRIIQSVRAGGDAALREWNRRIDRSRNRRIPGPGRGYRRRPESYLAPNCAPRWSSPPIASAPSISEQPLHSWIDAGADGSLGQLVRPVDSVGVYVPGGTAPLPSSLLMSAIPAQVAGVPEIIVCTPPGSGGGGVHPTILAAAAIAGVKRVYRVGGAQAIAAMAYGTESIPRVATIVGAGNLFVTLAKQQVYGDVGIDGTLGPTETLLIADGNADPRLAAADLLAQAEHDVLASAILITPSHDLARAVKLEIQRQLPAFERSDIMRESLRQRGGAVIARDLAHAFELANEYAAEHLCLLLDDPWSWIGQVRNAGGVFLGEHSYEVLGDYVAGPSHVMPTGGTARFASPLNLLHFVKITSLIALEPNCARALSQPAQQIARAESLTAHAAAARWRGSK